MQPKNIFLAIVSIAALLLPASLAAQKNVLIIFPEDDKINIPHTFLKNREKGTADSVPLKFLTIKYQFYNILTQRLVANNYIPLGGVNSKVNDVRKYTKKRWYSHDSATQKELSKKKYLAAAVDETNKEYYNLYATTDSADYIIFVNKVDVGANFFRKWLATKNYLLQVHFDVYDKNMKHLGGQYLRKKVRLTRDMYWSAFQKHFSVIPDELALYFANMKK
jgi:hypothetical protein